METLRENWLLISIPIVVTMLGGFVATWFELSPKIRSTIQHFSAGVVFAAVAGEVIPEVTDRHSIPATILGFSVGVGLMFAIAKFGDHLEGRAEANGAKRGFPVGLVGAVAIDGFVDGMVIGMGFAIGSQLGLLITVALSLEMFFLGLATAATLRGIGAPARQAFLVTVAAAATLALGALIGVTLFGGLPNAGMAAILAFGAAALLYLVTEELLIEAHTVDETRLMSSVFFLGFLVLLVIEMSM